MTGFWAMGGYAFFVWGAYGVSALGLAAALVWTLAAWRAASKRLRQLEGRK
jgi:heme exporter protein CcmD